MDDSIIRNKIEEIMILAEKEQVSVPDLSDLMARYAPDGNDTWEKVQLARRIDRPNTLDYINLICDQFMELHGDRHYGDDPAMIGGIGTIEDRAITFIGHQRGHNLKENLARNYGWAYPEGYRKALRLARQAEKFRRPVVTFIDTSGAYPGIEAEERGIGEAIAVNLKVFSMLKVPIICFIIGEGGSGGALGIGVADKVYMLENSIYSVISPEGFASILLRDAEKAKEAAEIMKITAKDIHEFGIVHGLIPEVPGGAHLDPGFTAQEIKRVIVKDMKSLMPRSPEQLIRYRSKKIREIGHVNKNTAKTQDLFGIFAKVFARGGSN
ncbi:MAG: acetyl-CoA carboxylase carboxyl transferase subunit alpha [spirochete symbiont of Stewartia floridana]|nr:MAG: acetyl-CoA carboxylase carboxyl transferase subunit alpha [spirochete symbiont of Stewartia floridana]